MLIVRVGRGTGGQQEFIIIQHKAQSSGNYPTPDRPLYRQDHTNTAICTTTRVEWEGYDRNKQQPLRFYPFKRARAPFFLGKVHAQQNDNNIYSVLFLIRIELNYSNKYQSQHALISIIRYQQRQAPRLNFRYMQTKIGIPIHTQNAFNVLENSRFGRGFNY